jgi:hypothetical protein
MSTEKILDERGNQYGDWAQMASIAQSLKRIAITPRMSHTQRESMDLICTKIARIVCGNPNHIDSWIDIAGYATLEVNTLSKDVLERHA